VPEEPAQPPDRRREFLLLGLGFSALLLLLRHLRATAASRIAFGVLAGAYTLVCGIAGLILAALWVFTQHWSGWHNENLLLLNPLCLLLLPQWVRLARRDQVPSRSALRLAAIVAGVSAAALLLRLIPGCYQDNLAWIALLLPPHAALLLSLRPPFAPRDVRVRVTVKPNLPKPVLMRRRAP
jgi:hypothetical protein